MINIKFLTFILKTSIILIFLPGCKKNQVPTLSTLEVANITSTTATSGGVIINEGSSEVYKRGVCWNTSQNPTESVFFTTDEKGTGPFFSLISGLTSNATYYVRAYATNSDGTGYGDELSFTTLENVYVHQEYQITMTKEFRLSRVKFLMNNELMTDEVYSYSDYEVSINDIITNSTIIYFLNSLGLADSSRSSNSVGVSYYLYDNEYLISYGAKDFPFHCDYTDGNRTKVQAVQYSCEYQFNSMQNIIDIESFKGSYLGKLNKNLIRSRECTYLMASDRTSSVYEYQYNSDGLVIKRTETTISQHVSQGSTIVITNFEYIIVD